ncbi:MAG: SAM-dependent methyltransferase [Rhodospirillales bacterium]|nr:SAM-dependent methyltransferase [Rhodospirillales bacterium]|tara:strand:+ start:472 stop:1245 length:774 start_codon:yes stop_codon:yes gene_type:complete
MVRNKSIAKAKQRWFADRYAQNAQFVSQMAYPLIELLNPKKGETILDLGCGNGALTKLISQKGANVIGVDASEDQILATKNLGITAIVMDGHKLAFRPVFDAILTNAALHWMTAPIDVLSGIRHALKPSGRLIGEMGGIGNIEKITSEIYASLRRRGLENHIEFPWYFPSQKEYKTHLENQGFYVKYINLFSRPTPLPGHFSDWMDTFAECFLLVLPEDDRAEFKKEVTDNLRPDLFDPIKGWVADYVRLRFSAVRR